MSELIASWQGWKSLRALGDLLLEAWDLVIWSEVRAGQIDVRGTPPPFRLAVRLGSGLVLLLACLLPFSDHLRASSSLLPLGMAEGERVLRYVPLVSVPLLYGLLALGWAYLLAGVSGATGLLRAPVVAFFGIFVLGLITPRDGMFPEARPWAFLAWGSLVLLLLLVSLGPRLLPRLGNGSSPALHLSAILVLCTMTLLGSYLAVEQIATRQMTGTNRAALRFSANTGLLAAFLVPFFLLAGTQVAVLAVDLGHSGARWLAARSQLRLWAWGLGAFLSLRLTWTWIYPILGGTPARLRWGAAMAVGLGLLGYALLQRRSSLEEGEAPPWSYIVPALLLMGPLPFFQSFTAVASLVVTLLPVSVERVQRFELLLGQATAAFLPFVHAYTFAVGGGLVIAGLAGWFRARPHLSRWALAFLCIGGWTLWWKVTRPLGPLGRWTFEAADFTALATAALAGLYGLLLVRRRLRPAVLSSLSAAALMLWLLEAYDLLSDPLSPLAALLRTGALFLAVSLLLSILEAGEYFDLNRGSPGLPHWSRAFLFLGYAIIAALFAHWEGLTHQPGYGEGYADTGFLLLGMPLALAALLALPAGEKSAETV